MSSDNGQTVNPDPSHVVQGMELGMQNRLLQAILAEARVGIVEVAVSDMQHRERVLEKFPVSGAKRILAYRTGSGTDTQAVPTTGVLVVPANVSRLGGQIVNSGANAVILYLTDTGLATPGKPAIWLASLGGSWDFRLGNLLWCGSVSAVAQTTATTLTVAEV